MPIDWADVAADVTAGDPDRVDRVIDDITGRDVGERVRLVDAWFEDLVDRYAASDDGYVRQSIVRVVEALTPGVVAAIDHAHGDTAIDDERLLSLTDTIRDFLLRAMTDDDGRVRRAAMRALEDVSRTYDALGEPDRIEALAADLRDRADDATGARRDHLLEAADDASFWRQTDVARVVEGFREELGGHRDQ